MGSDVALCEHGIIVGSINPCKECYKLTVPDLIAEVERLKSGITDLARQLDYQHRMVAPRPIAKRLYAIRDGHANQPT